MTKRYNLCPLLFICKNGTGNIEFVIVNGIHPKDIAMFGKEILSLFFVENSWILSFSAEIANKMTYKINHATIKIKTHVQGKFYTQFWNFGLAPSLQNL